MWIDLINAQQEANYKKSHFCWTHCASYRCWFLNVTFCGGVMMALVSGICSLHTFLYCLSAWRGYELQKRLHPSIRNNSVNFCRGNSFFRDQVTHSTHVTAIKMLVIAVHCQIWIQCFISQFISVNMYSRKWKLLLLCSSAGFICHELHHFTSSWFTVRGFDDFSMLTAMSDLNTV